MGTPPVDLQQRFRDEGVTFSDLSDNTAALRETVHALSESDMAPRRFIKNLARFRSDPNNAVLGYFIPFSDYIAAHKIGLVQTPKSPWFLNTSSLRQAIREQKKGESSILDEDGLGLFTFGFKAGLPPTACIFATPKYADAIFAARHSVAKTFVKKDLFDLPDLEETHQSNHETKAMEYGWVNHERLKHGEFTNHPSRLFDQYTRDNRIVWSHDMHVAAIPSNYGLGLRAAIYNGNGEFIKPIPVSDYTRNSGEIMGDVARGDYYARIHYTTYCPANGDRELTPLYTLVPGHAVRHLVFAEDTDVIEGVNTPSARLKQEYDLAAFFSISPDLRHIFLEVSKTATRGKQHRNRIKSMPVFEGTMIKRALEDISGKSTILLQGQKFNITSTGGSKIEREEVAFSFDQAAARFSAIIAPNGDTSDVCLAFGPDKGLAYFALSQAEHIRLKVASEEFDLRAV